MGSPLEPWALWVGTSKAKSVKTLCSHLPRALSLSHHPLWGKLVATLQGHPGALGKYQASYQHPVLTCWHASSRPTVQPRSNLQMSAPWLTS